MTELFSTNTSGNKPAPTQPQEIEFITAKKSKVKIIYKPVVIGGIAKSPVLIANLKQFMDDFEKESLVKEVKKDAT